MTCEDIRVDLGGYVLDGLSPEEELVVEGHLRTCAACRAEHAGLAGAPALLELVREAAPKAPLRVRDRVLSDVAGRRRGRRRLAVSAAAVLAAALIGGGAGWRLGVGQPPSVAVALDSPEPYEATGWATFRSAGDRLVVDLRLDGLEPLAAPGVYEAWLFTSDERILSIGQLIPDEDGTATVTLTADGPRDAYRGVWITAEPDARDPAHDGPTVLRAYVPPAS